MKNWKSLAAVLVAAGLIGCRTTSDMQVAVPDEPVAVEQNNAVPEAPAPEAVAAEVVETAVPEAEASVAETEEVAEETSAAEPVEAAVEKEETAPAPAAPKVEKEPAVPVTPPAEIEKEDNIVHVQLMTTEGNILLELYPDEAPETVENFLKYVRDGFYDETVFHRVINNFMIQGGGFNLNMDRKETGEPIRNEADNGLKNERGTVAMARTGEPHSATAQFFINVIDNDFLNYTAPSGQGWGYCVFGRVIDGMDTVDKIRVAETGTHGYFRDVPKQPIVIRSARIAE